MTCYCIPNWNETFENYRSRQIEDLHWVKIPNKHDSEGYRTIMSKPNGVGLYGAWALLLQVASKCPKRGVLARKNGKPHDAASLALVTGAPAEVFADAIAAFLDVGWLTTEEPSSTADVPSEYRPCSDGLAKKRREEKRREEETTLVAGAPEKTPEKKDEQPCPKNPVIERDPAPFAKDTAAASALDATNAAAPPVCSREPPMALARVLDASPTAPSERSVSSMAAEIVDLYRKDRKVKRPQCVSLVVKRINLCKTYDEKLLKFEALKNLTQQYVNSPIGRGKFCSNSDTFFRSKIEEDDPAAWQTSWGDGPAPQIRKPAPPSVLDTAPPGEFGIFNSLADALENHHVPQQCQPEPETVYDNDEPFDPSTG